jgi:HK97 family phage major capsid protein
MSLLKQLTEKRDELQAHAEALTVSATTDKRLMTDDERAQFDKVSAEIESVISDIKRAETVEAYKKKIIADRHNDNPQSELNRQSVGQDYDSESARITLPRSEYRYSPKMFAGEPEAARKDAYLAGRWAAAQIFNHSESKIWLDNNGFGVYNELTTGSNESAGFLVPEVLENSIISHFENYGVFAANIGMQKPMTGGTWKGPREVEGVTVTYPGEGVAATESTPKVGLVKLAAKDATAYIKVSRNLDTDAISAMGDMIVRAFARGIALAQDEAGFNGDGSSTYGGMVGIKNALLDGCNVTATGETTFGALTRERFESMVGRLPDWAGIQPKWYISKPGYYASMARLQMAAGGNAVADLGNGPVLQYLGYPVVFTSVLPKALTSLTAQRTAYFGDLEYAAAMGTAKGISIESDSSKFFLERMLAVMAFLRYDINVYEVGTADNAGGMIALKMG